MRFTVGSPSMQLLRLAGLFAQPEGDAGADKGGGGDKAGGDGGADKGGAGGKGTESGGEGGKEGGDKGKKGGEGQPVPYSRFQEVSAARRTAERGLATATAQIETLTAQLAQATSGDSAAALKTAQDQVAELTKTVQAIEDEFEDMLEAALTGLDDDDAAMIRDLPGGARAQFAFLNKHRARLTGGSESKGSEEKKGVKGAKHEKKPEGGEKAGPSGAARTYVESVKPKEKGFAGLA